MTWLVFALMTVVSWGVYGIFLHTGQTTMGGGELARYRAFLFVGLAYFLTAVLAPLALLMLKGGAWSGYTVKGMGWSLLAGIVGAVGAFGVLLAFGAGGKPGVVMSIVFAGAPVINAGLALLLHPPAGGWSSIKPQFYLGILLAALGGCLVTLYKPAAGPAKDCHRPNDRPPRVPQHSLTTAMPPPFPKRLAIVQWQTDQLRALVSAILPANPFYSAKFDEAAIPRKISTPYQLTQDMPFTTKRELVEDQIANPPYGTNLTYPLERYARCHQTSGTQGTPLRWLDTTESWEWILRNWEYVHRTAGVTAADRVFFAFSFGPFLGFWSAFEAAIKIGCLCLPGGGYGSSARLRALLDHQATVLCCTPTYALRLAEVAAEEGISLAEQPVRRIITAGEPGGSIPATRARIEELWPGAQVYDHHGMTEVGAVTFECPARPGVLHVMENAYLPEVIDPTTGQAVDPGDTGELVLTPLGRLGSPVLRYRTGDLVKIAEDDVCQCGRSDLALEGGILGRVDDMVVVRGVKVFPSAIEEIIRTTGGVAEYQVVISKEHSMTELKLTIEPTRDCPDSTALARKLEKHFEESLLMRLPVSVASPGALPRFEMKAKRWIKS